MLPLSYYYAVIAIWFMIGMGIFNALLVTFGLMITFHWALIVLLVIILVGICFGFFKLYQLNQLVKEFDK